MGHIQQLNVGWGNFYLVLKMNLSKGQMRKTI